MENMNPYVEIVRKDPRDAQEQMVRFSLAGFTDLYNQYKEALEIVQKENEPVKEEIKEVVTEVSVEAPVKKTRKKVSSQ